MTTIYSNLIKNNVNITYSDLVLVLRLLNEQVAEVMEGEITQMSLQLLIISIYANHIAK